jgi:hypothetical protein
MSAIGELMQVLAQTNKAHLAARKPFQVYSVGLSVVARAAEETARCLGPWNR